MAESVTGDGNNEVRCVAHIQSRNNVAGLFHICLAVVGLFDGVSSDSVK